jgi:hypothetical protein
MEARTVYKSLCDFIAKEALVPRGFVRKGNLLAKAGTGRALVMLELNRLPGGDDVLVQFNVNAGAFLPEIHDAVTPDGVTYSLEKKVLPRSAIWHYRTQIQPKWAVQWDIGADTDPPARAVDVIERIDEGLRRLQPIASLQGLVEHLAERARARPLSLMDQQVFVAARAALGVARP